MNKYKSRIFEFGCYRNFLREVIGVSPRGYQAKLAGAMGCQAIYLIRSLKGEAQLSEEQAFRAARFIGLSEFETEYFLDLLRFAKAADEGLRLHLRGRLREQVEKNGEIAKRAGGQVLTSPLKTQIEYYSSWKPSILHLATSCRQFRTIESLAKRFSLDVNEVSGIIEFLVKVGLVLEKNEHYEFSGNSLHLPKGSPLHKIFQRERRELIVRGLEKSSTDAFHFSSAFATSKSHCDEIRSTLLDLIEKLRCKLKETESEEVQILAIDFGQVI